MNASFQKVLVYLLLCGMLTSCSSISYVMQAGYGQLKIFNQAQPVEDVLQNPKTTAQEKKILSEMPAIRSYAQTLGLKENKNYKNYVRLDQPYVSYIVAASDPLEFKPKTWDFPIVGSFNYIGFHDEKKANDYAEKLKKEEKLDVTVRGARAYSTLGWFSDPILSSMILQSEFALGYFVNLIIHETVHVTVYVPGQSYFNESLAEFFADQVTPRYLKEKYGEKSLTTTSYMDYVQRGEVYGKNFNELYLKLATLYASTEINPEEKLSQKKKWIDAVLLKLKNPQLEINNATLVQYKTYGVGQKEFMKLFEFVQKSPQRWIECVSLIKKEDFKKEHEEDFNELIDGLIKSSCSRPQQ